MRAVLSNHCINVPPHQPIAGKRKIPYSDPHQLILLSHPPSFVPQGRTKSTASFDISSTTSSPSLTSKDQTPPPAGNGVDDVSRSSLVESGSISQHSFEDNEVISESVSEEAVNGDLTSSSLSRHSSSSSASLSGDGSLEHIVIRDRTTTPTLSATHVGFCTVVKYL